MKIPPQVISSDKSRCVESAKEFLSGTFGTDQEYADKIKIDEHLLR
jgi:hypothetical protein